MKLDETVTDSDGVEWEVFETGEGIKHMPKFHFDEKYLEAYCSHPELGKSEALAAAGYAGKYLKQEANRIHNRLRDRIETRLDEMILDGGHVGYSVMLELAKKSDSDTVKASCAKNLMDYAGRKPGDKLIVTDERSDDELDIEIARVQKSIEERGGKKLDS